MFQVLRMLKVKTFTSGRDITVLTRDGRLSILTKRQEIRLRE